MPGLDLEELAVDSTIYLIDEAESEDECSEFLISNYESFFEFELSAWYQDESIWPENRTYEMFEQWFDVRLHTIILDTVEQPIEKEED